jgi:serine/threonine protein kinase
MEKFGTGFAVTLKNGLQALSASKGSSATLFDFIERFGALSPRLCRSIFSQIASAVHALHSLQIVHGDIKEENILIEVEDGQHFVKLCDFGHAQRVRRGRPRMKFYGTKDISAPELITSKEPVTGYAQDIWV